MEQVALTVSIVSGVAGLVALLVALRANHFAKISLTKALEANDLAKEANEYSDRAEARELERNDVDWDWRSDGFGVVVFVNDGQDSAYSVRAVVGVGEGPKQTLDVDEVPPGGELRFEFAKEAQDRLLRVRESRSRTAAFRGADLALSMGEYLSVKITWKTERGRHSAWDPKLVNSDLGVAY